MMHKDKLDAREEGRIERIAKAVAGALMAVGVPAAAAHAQEAGESRPAITTDFEGGIGFRDITADDVTARLQAVPLTLTETLQERYALGTVGMNRVWTDGEGDLNRLRIDGTFQIPTEGGDTQFLAAIDDARVFNDRFGVEGRVSYGTAEHNLTPSENGWSASAGALLRFGNNAVGVRGEADGIGGDTSTTLDVGVRRDMNIGPVSVRAEAFAGTTSAGGLFHGQEGLLNEGDDHYGASLTFRGRAETPVNSVFLSQEDWRRHGSISPDLTISYRHEEGEIALVPFGGLKADTNVDAVQVGVNFRW